ncbi:uncharacterized protein N7459_002067 [Penicillium hispanicum]|uniref:uncharacterized protein n=1 Tax=Penicillium hispanicum TaxID=1080232 RepID=UPI00254174B6|nr:uncharacterized protein N7459_002067 [Penicillium hispanicum]KAJ5591698.1 hypothetical protein N7459_002067 [Penicillium hispanicum]
MYATAGDAAGVRHGYTDKYSQKGQRNLYIADGNVYQSYSIAHNYSLVYQGNTTFSESYSYSRSIWTWKYALTFVGDSANFIISADTAPFTVFVKANITYGSDSGVHGLALGPDNRFIYSGDDTGSSVWTHSYDEATKKVTNLQRLNVTSNPGHLVVSPQGSLVYVILEQDNDLAVFNRDKSTGLLTGRNRPSLFFPRV